MSVITCIEDLRVLARKRVPLMFYDYVGSGSWTESTYGANAADSDRLKSPTMAACFSSSVIWPRQAAVVHSFERPTRSSR